MDNKENASELTFEEAMAKLGELVSAMESGKLPLDSLINSYEEGSRLVKFCRAKLAKLENRIEILSKDDGAQGSWAEFDPASGEGENAGRQSAIPF